MTSSPKHLVCPVCQQPFTTRRPNQKYCSHQCAPRFTTKTSKQRGLGVEHQKRRAQLLPRAIGTPCPLCGHTMTATQALELDHSVPRSMGGTTGDRITHASCNRSRGDGTRRTPIIDARRRTAPTTPPTTSRQW